MSAVSAIELAPEERGKNLEAFLQCFKQLGKVPRTDSLTLDFARASFGVDYRLDTPPVETSADADWGVNVEFPNEDEVLAFNGTPEIIEHCVGMTFFYWGFEEEPGDDFRKFEFTRKEAGKWALDETVALEDIPKIDRLISSLAVC